MARLSLFNSSWRSRVARLGFAVLAASVILAFPFFILVRASLWFDRALGFSAWLALMSSVLLTASVLLLYTLLAARRLTRRRRLPRFTARGLALLVACYALYAVVYLAAANAKGPAVRASYRALHPSLRLAVTTLILVDGDLVMSDALRLPAEYTRMGLPRRANSTHYEQQDGWVHALDLRTRGRSASRNFLVRCYFEALGFDALRHGGSADHLHVSLPAG